MGVTGSQTARGAIAVLREIIEDTIKNNPRSLQRALGPSEVGNGCDRCLVQMLHFAYRSGDGSKPKLEADWLPYIGTAVHAGLAGILIDGGHTVDQGGDWLVENRVDVGYVGEHLISGSADVFHVPTGVVVDYKIAGTTTLNKVRFDGSGCSVTYQRQVQCYARGMDNRGLDVRGVAVWFIPRNGRSLAMGRLFTDEYRPDVAHEALSRASLLLAGIDTYGVESMIAHTPPHTFDEFSCDRYAKPDEYTLSAMLGN